MLDNETVLSFSIASIALCMAPGPDNLFVLSQSATHGRAAGFYVTAGLCTGLLFHTAAVVLGLAAVFQASAVAFNIVKIAGVAYLLFLAWKAFTAKAQGIEQREMFLSQSKQNLQKIDRPIEEVARDVPGSREEKNKTRRGRRVPPEDDWQAGRFYRRGVVMNVTNPKVSIFFLAFLPQFVKAGNGSATGQIVVLGLMFIGATIVIFGGVAFMGGALRDFLIRSPKAQLIMNKVSGVVLAALALRLAVTGIR